MKKINQLVTEFMAQNDDKNGPDAVGAISVWLPDGYKQKYSEIQERSKGKNKRFSAVVREILVEVIDSAYETK